MRPFFGFKKQNGIFVFDYLIYLSDDFTFDFMKAQDLGYYVNPIEIKVDATTYKFYYEEEDLSNIHQQISMTGIETLQQIGKLCQKGNLLVMNRRIKVEN